MKIFIKDRWLLLFISIGIGSLFLYAGLAKIEDPMAFSDSIATFGLLPPQLINILALALPPFEIILGISLIVGWKRRMALLGISILAVIFTVALGQAILRGLNVDCGCFGSGTFSMSKLWFSLVKSALIAATSIWLYTRIRIQHVDESK